MPTRRGRRGRRRSRSRSAGRWRRRGAAVPDPSPVGATRPVGLVQSPVRKRYHDGPASVDDDVHAVRLVGPGDRPRPNRRSDVNASSAASSHATVTSSPPRGEPSGRVSRVHSTADRSSGSPDVTPSVNGLSVGTRRADTAGQRGVMATAAPRARSWRRESSGHERHSHPPTAAPLH